MSIAEHKAEHKAEQKSENKAEQKPEQKSEHKKEQHAEKKHDKKLAEKTETVEKKTATPVVIKVPLYHQENDDVVATSVTYLKIIPSKKGKDWKTLLVQKDEMIEPSSITYDFESNTNDQGKESPLEPYQKSVIVVDLPAFEGGDSWRFHDTGIMFFKEAQHCRVSTELTNLEQRLVITIDQVEAFGTPPNDCETLAFRYLASCIDCTKDKAGKLRVYYSQDPQIVTRRHRLG